MPHAYPRDQMQLDAGHEVTGRELDLAGTVEVRDHQLDAVAFIRLRKDVPLTQLAATDRRQDKSCTVGTERSFRGQRGWGETPLESIQIKTILICGSKPFDSR